MQENSDPFLAKNLEPTPEKVEILLRLLTPFISSYYKDGVKVFNIYY